MIQLRRSTPEPSAVVRPCLWLGNVQEAAFLLGASYTIENIVDGKPEESTCYMGCRITQSSPGDAPGLVNLTMAYESSLHPYTPEPAMVIPINLGGEAA